MVSAVLDSGPLIHLAEIRCFRALRIAEVVVPAVVAIEVTRSNKPGSQELKDSQVPVIELTEDEKVLAQQLCHRYRIEVGEAEAIALCISRRYDLFLTDDAAARDVGEVYNLEVHGTAGIVARAYHEGLLSHAEIKRAMQELYETSSLYMSERVYKLVLEMLENQADE
jgi:predicted nucleic acid-binding protein